MGDSIRRRKEGLNKGEARPSLQNKGENKTSGAKNSSRIREGLPGQKRHLEIVCQRRKAQDITQQRKKRQARAIGRVGSDNQVDEGKTREKVYFSPFYPEATEEMRPLKIRKRREKG